MIIRFVTLWTERQNEVASLYNPLSQIEKKTKFYFIILILQNHILQCPDWIITVKLVFDLML